MTIVLNICLGIIYVILIHSIDYKISPKHMFKPIVILFYYSYTYFIIIITLLCIQYYYIIITKTIVLVQFDKYLYFDKHLLYYFRGALLTINNLFRCFLTNNINTHLLHMLVQK